MMITSNASMMPLERLASPYHKCTTPIRKLAYGIPGDLVDEYVRMSESTCRASLYKFYKVVLAAFAPEYLREPTVVVHPGCWQSMNQGQGCLVA